MRKIPTVFKRDPDDRAHVLPEVTPGCEWVLNGEGVATRKYDGTCVMLDESGEWWARREVKPGKATPDGFQVVEKDIYTGRAVGWEPISQSSFFKFWREALAPSLEPGTYELCGPKINGNPEGFEGHALLRHEDAVQMSEMRIGDPVSRDFATIRGTLDAYQHTQHPPEGIVWHHPDGRMAKIKRKDFRGMR